MRIKLFSRRNFKIVIVFFFLITVFLFLNHSVWAQDLGTNYAKNLGLQDGGGKDLRVVIVNVVKYLLTFLGIIAVSMIMYSGFLWMTSGGDPEKVSKARKTLINSAIGLIITISAFAIVSFIANLFGGGVGSHHLAGGGGPGAGYGYGVLGACSVESVYPVPGQKEVPRNTVLVVSFKEPVQANTLCDDVNSNNLCDNEALRIENIRILYSQDADNTSLNCLYCDTGASSCPCDSQAVDVLVAGSADNKTFVFSFATPLGSPSEYIKYTAYFNNNILKTNGRGIFDSCSSDYLRWDFEVSDKLDLSPPQIKENGVFPFPDNERDDTNVINASQAQGLVIVLNNSLINEYVPANFGPINPSIGAPSISLSNQNLNLSTGGSYILAVNTSANLLSMSIDGNGAGQVPIVDDGNGNITAVFDGFFTVSFSSYPGAGNSWTFNVSPAQKGDTLNVDTRHFVFGKDITVGANANQTASNIALVINSSLSTVTAMSSTNRVSLVAQKAGLSGNNILLSSDNQNAFQIEAMHGGSAQSVNRTIKDKEDKAMNAIIQINFNEAVNPLTVSGAATELASNGLLVRVENCFDLNGNVITCPFDAGSDGFFACGSGVCVDGDFKIANGYKTVEFVPDNLCGVNACGENIYCLPANTQLQVEVPAASLLTCSSDADCANKNPYTQCVSSRCQNASAVNYPMARSPFDGVIDMAVNSLDGDRDKNPEGKVAFYDENTHTGGGDNFQWHFFVSDQMDTTPPIIENTAPQNNESGVNTDNSLRIRFSELMMLSSLKTGLTKIYNGKEYHIHYLVNLRDFTGGAVGYWTAGENIDDNPIDGVPDKTMLYIDHSVFGINTNYTAQIGSGVKDIYQNCFKPSRGPACPGVDADNPSCCSGTASPNETCD